MKKSLIILLLCTISLVTLAQAEIVVHEFYQTTCPHCQNVIQSGILEKVDAREDVKVETYEVTTPGGYLGYQEMQKRVDLQQGVPLVVIECEDGGFIQLIGDTPIINTLEENIEKCYTGDYPKKSNTFWYFIGFLAIAGGAYYYMFHVQQKSLNKKV